MTTTSRPTTPASDHTHRARPRGTGRRQLPVALAVAGSQLAGLVAALVLVLVVLAGGTEPVITGAALIGFGSGWALLGLVSTRWTSQPQRWAHVPAVMMATTGIALLITRPAKDVLTAAGWVWPPAALVLALWMARAARRTSTRGTRWLVYPAISLLTAVALGGAVATVALALDDTGDTMPGALYDVGGHRLHLSCTGTGSPTVVLENGLNEISPLWDAITTQVSRTTRVCAHDRAGQAWSDDISHPQDGLAVAADLHTLLARAGEHGPYVLAGHSSGGTLAMTYAARYPAQVAGMVLLDSSSPHQYTDQPDFAGTYAMPLAVVTARENAEGTQGWAAAQNRVATLSTNSTHWTADTTHVGLLDDATGSTHSIRAITAVITAVRTSAPLTNDH